MSSFTPTEQARLREVRQRFIHDMQQLTPEQQLRRAKAIAGGIRRTDPYTRALAQQMVDVAKENDLSEAAKARIREIEEVTARSGYRPHDPDFRTRLLAEKHDLEQSLQVNAARALGIAEDGLTSAQTEALTHFREEDARHERAQRIMAEVERLTAEQEAADVQRLAANIAAGRRIGIGKEAEQLQDA